MAHTHLPPICSPEANIYLGCTTDVKECRVQHLGMHMVQVTLGRSCMV